MRLQRQPAGLKKLMQELESVQHVLLEAEYRRQELAQMGSESEDSST